MATTPTLWPWILAAGSLALAGWATWRARQTSADAARLHGEITHLRLLLHKASQEKAKASADWRQLASATMDRAHAAAGHTEMVVLTARELGARVRDSAAGFQELSNTATRGTEAAAGVSATTNAQAEALKEMAGESARMAAGLDGLNLGVGCATLLSETCLDLVREGGARLDGAATALTAGEAAISQAGALSVRLSAATAQIAEGAAQITLLADQTNHAARNASLQAGWAGEAEDLFAGVAQEIRALAERSAAAAMAVIDIAVKVQADIESLQGAVASAGHDIHTGIQALGETATGLACMEQVEQDTRRSLAVAEETVLRLKRIGGRLAQKAEEAAAGTAEQLAMAAQSAAVAARLRESVDAMALRTAATTTLVERLSTEARENRVSALLVLEEVMRWSGPVIDLLPEGSFPDASAVA